jgi:hypothetical protein
MLKSSYQLNSIIFDILNDFNYDNDLINEKAYNQDLCNYIHYYCTNEFNENDALIILNETFDNYVELNNYNLSALKFLEVILVQKLTDIN